jgi:hypothetical protein
VDTELRFAKANKHDLVCFIHDARGKWQAFAGACRRFGSKARDQDDLRPIPANYSLHEWTCAPAPVLELSILPSPHPGCWKRLLNTLENVWNRTGLWRRQSVKAEPVLLEQNRRHVHINRGTYCSHLSLETRVLQYVCLSRDDDAFTDEKQVGTACLILWEPNWGVSEFWLVEWSPFIRQSRTPADVYFGGKRRHFKQYVPSRYRVYALLETALPPFLFWGRRHQPTLLRLLLDPIILISLI